MRVLLLGANGRTGRQILNRALNAGDRVTAVVRARDRLADVRHERLEVHVGSPCDSKGLEALLPGHDVVISMLGPRRPTRRATAIYRDAATAIVAAMTQTPVKRLLVVSSALLFPEDDLFVRGLRWIVPSVVEGARQMEEIVLTSALDWTIIRTGFLTNSSASNYRVGVGSLPEGSRSLSRAALAEFALRDARRPSHSREIVGLAG